MPEQKGRKKKPALKPAGKKPVRAGATRLREKPVIDLLPGLLVQSLVRHDDFIMTCEVDPDTEKKTLHIISGRFVTPCMLRKLIGQAESQRDEGGMIISRKWQ